MSHRLRRMTCDRRPSRDERPHAAGSLRRMPLLESAVDYKKNPCEVREVARIEPAPHFFAPAAALAAAALGSQFFYSCATSRRATFRTTPRAFRSLRSSPSAYRSRLGAPRIVRASELPYGRHSRCGSRSVTSALVWAYRGLYERVRRLAGAAVRR